MNLEIGQGMEVVEQAPVLLGFGYGAHGAKV